MYYDDTGSKMRELEVLLRVTHLLQCVAVCCFRKTSDMGWLRLVNSIFCKRDLYSAKETCDFKEPTRCGHPMMIAAQSLAKRDMRS